MGTLKTITLTEALTGKAIELPTWAMQVVERGSKFEDFGLFDVPANEVDPNALCKWFPKYGEPVVSEITYSGSDTVYRVLHTKDEIEDAFRLGYADIHMNPPLQRRFIKHIEEAATEKSVIYVPKFFGSADARAPGENGFATVMRTAGQLIAAIKNGLAFDGDRPASVLEIVGRPKHPPTKRTYS